MADTDAVLAAAADPSIVDVASLERAEQTAALRRRRARPEAPTEPIDTAPLIAAAKLAKAVAEAHP